jgi:hypothetical protein
MKYPARMESEGCTSKRDLFRNPRHATTTRDRGETLDSRKRRLLGTGCHLIPTWIGIAGVPFRFWNLNISMV